MYPSSVTLFWRDKTQTTKDAEGNDVETPYPPVTQDVAGFFVEGNALILVQDEMSSYLIPLDILDAVSIFRKEVEGEADSGNSDGEASVLSVDFEGSGGNSEGGAS